MTLELLIENTRHPDLTVRRQAVGALGEYRTAEAISALIEALSDPARPVADRAVHSLLRIGGRDVAEAVGSLVSHPEITLRCLALEVVLGLGATAGPVLINLLDSEDRELRKSAAEVLGESGYKEAGPKLQATVVDPDPVVRSAVLGALAGLNYQECLPVLLARWAVETEEWVRYPLAAAILRLGTEEQALQLLVGEGPDSLIQDLVRAELQQRRGGGEAP